jgi:hypothetical protein
VIISFSQHGHAEYRGRRFVLGIGRQQCHLCSANVQDAPSVRQQGSGAAVVVRPQSASLHAMAVEQGGSPLHPPFQVPSKASDICEVRVDAAARVEVGTVPVRTSVECRHTTHHLMQHTSCLAAPLLYTSNSTEQTCLVSPAGALGAAGTARRHRCRAGGQEGEGALSPSNPKFVSCTYSLPLCWRHMCDTSWAPTSDPSVDVLQR